MTQEDKDLLFKDLCARLPYGVKIEVIYFNENASSFRQRVCVEGINELNADIVWLYQHHEIDIKPYLFPLSCMTEEQFEDILDIVIPVSKSFINTTADAVIEDYKVDRYVDFCNKNHLDWRGLIPRGLANDATGLNIY